MTAPLLWRFGRPHTLIGSLVSLASLWCLAQPGTLPDTRAFLVLAVALVCALAANLYITGLNQLMDVAVDRINKPHLPVASGELSERSARFIVVFAGVVALGAAALQGFFMFALIALIMAIGTAYSLPPLRLKRHHVAAAMAIAMVRGVLVNAGFWYHFHHAFSGMWQWDARVLPLVLFAVFFSWGIAWFKDVPDTEGDRAFRFGTLAVRVGRRRAFSAGVALVLLAYAAVALAGTMVFGGFCWVLCHAVLAALFVVMAKHTNVTDTAQAALFYRRYWYLFFLEYLLYPILAQAC
jgi:homogentisate phytyltransferase / homogentisate geranylgeranyltransferase